MRNCSIATVRRALAIATVNLAAPAEIAYAPLTKEKVKHAVRYLTKPLNDTYKTWLPVTDYRAWIWVRLCTQLYLEVSDFEFVGNALKVLCEKFVKKDTGRASQRSQRGR